MGVSETVLAAMIGAIATVLTALFQLISSFRAASGDRRSSKKGGLRSFMWTVALVLAAGVGGFAYAEFRSQESRDETRALRTELQAQMQALQASTARIEQLRFAPADNPAVAASSATATSTTMVTLPACKGPQVGFATDRVACTEQDALQVSVCAPLPVNAQVAAVELFSRPEDASTPWQDARTTAGQDVGSGRFSGLHVERNDGEQGKVVCQAFSHWGDKPRTVRMLVRYTAAVRTPG